MNLEDDGVTHINVYSKGATALGRALSNFARIPVVVVPNGRFESVEAYWYWLRVMEVIDLLRLGARPERDWGREIEIAEAALNCKGGLRFQYGANAKNTGQNILAMFPKIGPTEPTESFICAIKEAITIKITSNDWLAVALRDSGQLPLKHYYWFGSNPKNVKIVEPKEHRWVMAHLESIRAGLQKGSPN